MQDGSVVMTKAQVEGVINAISGKIAGFEISQGKIGKGGNYDKGDDTNGLALYQNFIRFCNGNQKTMLGCLNQFGFPYNGYMSLTDTTGSTLELYHKLPSTSDEEFEDTYKPKALAVYGNQYNVGKISAMETGYIGEAFSDIIDNWVGVTLKYQFESCNTGRLIVELPKKTTIDNISGNKPVIFDLEIVCGMNMKNTVVLYPSSDTKLYLRSHPMFKSEWNFSSNKPTYSIEKVAGKTIGSYDMVAGDSLRIRYANGVYYILDCVCGYSGIK